MYSAPCKTIHKITLKGMMDHFGQILESIDLEGLPSLPQLPHNLYECGLFSAVLMWATWANLAKLGSLRIGL
jgi:hypothetical protein